MLSADTLALTLKSRMALVADTNVYSLDSDCLNYVTCALPRLFTRSSMASAATDVLRASIRPILGSTVFDNVLASLFGYVATLTL